MRREFQKWLLLVVVIAFVLTFLGSYYIQTQQARANVNNLIGLRLQDAEEMIRTNNEDLADLRGMADAAALAKCRALAELIEQDPSIAELERGRPEYQSRINEILEMLDVDQFHISDEKGILVVSTSGNEGYDMNADAGAIKVQSAAFMGAITDPDFEMVQDILPRGSDGELFQYAGVARRDQPGIVQIGYYPDRLLDAMEVADIRNLASGFRIGNGGYIVVLRDGVVLSSPEDQLHIDGMSLGELGISGSKLVQREPFEFDWEGVTYYGLGRSYAQYLLLGLVPDTEMFSSRDSLTVQLVVSNLILFLVIFILISWLVQSVVIRGIQRINRSLKKITAGDLEEQVEVRNNSEFISLSDGINTMVDALKDAIAAEAARIDSDLEFARSIQVSSLPNVFPPYPERKEFSLFATMDTAKEVGGDFYDFFLIGDRRLAVLIADVSGKGIPAAMFMMRAKTLINSLAKSGMPPSQVFAAANDQLCSNNDAEMFVTAFMALLDTETGRLTCVNAGHNRPLLKSKGGEYQWLNVKPCFILGGMEGIAYRQQELQMNPGDKLYLYTDGVTEALNSERELFSDQRLIDLLNSRDVQSLGVEELLPRVHGEIDAFAAGAEQADDITMLALEYHGPPGE